jgi:hypothetical protein
MYKSIFQYYITVILFIVLEHLRLLTFFKISIPILIIDCLNHIIEFKYGQNGVMLQPNVVSLKL